MHKPENPVILIVGEGSHLGQLVQLAESVSPRALVSVIPPEDISSLRNLDDPNVIIIGGTTESDGTFNFPPSRIGWSLHGNKTIHHPIVFSDLIEMDYSGRVVSCGYPGSGNGILQAILDNLLASTAKVQGGVVRRIFKSIPRKFFSRIQRRSSSSSLSLLITYAANYHQLIDNLMTQYGKTFGESNLGVSTFREGEVCCVWQHQNETSVLIGLNTRNYLFEPHHKTHEPYGNKIRAIHSAGGHCFLAVRDPLDILVSVAKKLANYGINILSSEQLFREVARGLVAYYRSFATAIETGNIQTIRYEQVIGDFDKTTESLANCLGVAIDGKLVRQLREKLLNKSFAHAGHFWKPGVGKWKNFISPSHLEILKSEGMEGISNFLGYSFPSCSDLEHLQEMEVAQFERGNIGGLIAFLVYCGIDPVTAINLLRNDYGNAFISEAGNLIFISRTNEAQNIFAQFIRNTELMNYISSGTLESKQNSALQRSRAET